MEFAKKTAPGFLLCLALAVPSWLLGHAFPVVGGPVFAILAGMLVALALKDRACWQAGIAFTSKKILQYAVILLGFGLNLSQIAKVGALSLPIICTTITMSLVIAFVLRKCLAVPSNISVLVGVALTLPISSAAICAALGLIVPARPAVLAGLFTTNAFKAAPVQVCQQTLREYGTCRAVLANSGQANACTGDEGLENCLETRRMVAALTGLAPHEIMPMSTGVIGDQLKMDRWREAVPSLVESLGSRDAEGFTRAFMTTDAFPKFASITVPLSGGTVRLTGMAKGAGMICPNMATMLAVMLTDADVDRETWQAMFARAVDKTFNRVSVDGDTSTNDTILGLANGASGIRAEGEDAALLEKGLTDILGQISYMLVKDGEGASKVMHITVSGAASDEDACRIARTVGHSQLVKTAIYGQDANWGRIVAAVGRSGAQVDPSRVRLVLCGIERFRDGQPVNGDKEAELSELLKATDIPVEIHMGLGDGCYDLRASDLGHEYVSLNADYRS